MGRNLYIQDSAECIIRNKMTGNIVAVGCASTAGVNITVESTPIKGGIGNKTCYVIKSSKDIELTVDSSTYQNEFLEMVQGGEHESDVTSQVQARSNGKVIDDAGALTFELPTKHASLSSIRLEDVTGKQTDLIVTSGKVALPVDFKAIEGESLTFFYMKEIKGSKFTIDAAKFGNKLEITMKTLCYDVNTEAVYSDLYWVFPSVSSTGNFDFTMTAGEALIPSMTFTVTASGGETELAYKYEDIRPEFVRP